MPLLTPRQRGLAVLVIIGVVVAVAAAAGDQTRWAVTVLAVLVGAGCLLLLDVRRRQQAGARAQRRLEDGVQDLSTRLSDAWRAADRRAADHARLLAEVDGALRTEVGAAARRHEEIARHHDEAARRDEDVTRRLSHLDYEPVNEVQALLQLLPKLPSTAPPLPDVGGWALTARSLLGIWDVIERERPTTIVECGSGTSTLWLGYAARATGARVISLEHQGTYLEHTRELIAEHGLEGVAQVHHAPLRPVEVDGRTGRWYDLDDLDQLGTIDLLIVDGPPKSTGAMARLPAVPLLRGRLADGAAVVMDDAQRPDEQEAVRQWSERYGLRLERSLSRDAVLLRHVASQQPAD